MTHGARRRDRSADARAAIGDRGRSRGHTLVNPSRRRPHRTHRSDAAANRRARRVSHQLCPTPWAVPEGAVVRTGGRHASPGSLHRPCRGAEQQRTVRHGWKPRPHGVPQVGAGALAERVQVRSRRPLAPLERLPVGVEVAELAGDVDRVRPHVSQACGVPQHRQVVGAPRVRTAPLRPWGGRPRRGPRPLPRSARADPCVGRPRRMRRRGHPE